MDILIKPNSSKGQGDTKGGSYKRYNLVLPAPVYEEIKTIAEQRQITIMELMRKFIKLGFIASAAEEAPGTELILREEGKTDKKLVLV